MNPIPKNVMVNKNKAKSWDYGYNSKYDIIVISKTGKIGDIVLISGIKIALPPTPIKCLQRHKTNSEQYWERLDMPEELGKIKSIFQWNTMPSEFKDRWVDYIEEEFDRRESKVYGIRITVYLLM